MWARFISRLFFFPSRTTSVILQPRTTAAYTLKSSCKKLISIQNNDDPSAQPRFKSITATELSLRVSIYGRWIGNYFCIIIFVFAYNTIFCGLRKYRYAVYRYSVYIYIFKIIFLLLFIIITTCYYFYYDCRTLGLLFTQPVKLLSYFISPLSTDFGRIHEPRQKWSTTAQSCKRDSFRERTIFQCRWICVRNCDKSSK